MLYQVENGPLVSVIIPVNNGERYLSEAIESVLAQTYRPIEIIVIDDGSTDKSAEIAQRFAHAVRYYYLSHAGAGAARNQGIRLAHGNFFAFLDADDIWPDQKLYFQTEFLEKNPLFEIVLGHVYYYIKSSDNTGENTQFKKIEKPFFSFNLGSALFRKSVFDKVGLFDPALHFSEDVDWFMRARELCIKIVIIQKDALFYRQHESSMTHRRSPRDLNLIEVFKKSLDRRRKIYNGSAKSLPDIPVFSESNYDRVSTGRQGNSDEA